MSTTRRTVTVRELGGEIWAEIMHGLWRGPSSKEKDTAELQRFVDIAVGTLARHVGKVIENDSDLPVEALPLKNIDGPGGGVS